MDVMGENGVTLKDVEFEQEGVARINNDTASIRTLLVHAMEQKRTGGLSHQGLEGLIETLLKMPSKIPFTKLPGFPKLPRLPDLFPWELREIENVLSNGIKLTRYPGTYPVRCMIMGYLNHNCPLKVEQFLFEVFDCEYHYCKASKAEGKKCRDKNVLGDLVTQRVSHQWSKAIVEARLDLFHVDREVRRQMIEARLEREAQNAIKIAEAIAQGPDRNFRNNKDGDGPALIMHYFPRLPLELRNKVWGDVQTNDDARILTLDGQGKPFSKIAQITPENPEAWSRNVVRYGSALLRVNHESRNLVLSELDGYVYLSSTNALGSKTLKVQFSNAKGELVFINSLKLCALALRSASFRDGLEGSVSKNITTLAINDRNLFIINAIGPQIDTQFAVVGDIIRKFTQLQELWIVKSAAHGFMNLTSSNKLVDRKYGPEAPVLLSWSIRRMTPAGMRQLFETYASNHLDWKVPVLRIMSVATPLEVADTKKYKVEGVELVEKTAVSKGDEKSDSTKPSDSKTAETSDR